MPQRENSSERLRDSAWGSTTKAPCIWSALDPHMVVDMQTAQPHGTLTEHSAFPSSGEHQLLVLQNRVS